MAHQVASSAANLQQALAILQAERETCRDESVRLEARLKDSDRVRSEITRAIDLVERAKNDLKDNVRVMPTPVQQSDIAPAMPALYCKGRTCGSRQESPRIRQPHRAQCRCGKRRPLTLGSPNHGHIRQELH